MRSSTFASLLALAAAPVSAIPPEDFGFPSAPNDTALVVAYNYNGNVTTVTEGALFGAGITTLMPTVAVNTAAYMSLAQYTGQYVVIMVDPDASTPQNPQSRFILHWMQPNMMPSTTTSMDFPGQPLMNTTAPVVPYAMPMPPATSDAHRYILYAFEQPSDFAVPDAYSGYNAMNRTMFNLTDFVSAANLGTPAAAMFYFCSAKDQVPEDFIALPGGTYAGGNGGMITMGASGPATATAMSASMSATMSATGSAMSTGTAGAATTGTMTATASAMPGTTNSLQGNLASAISAPGSMFAYLMAAVGAVGAVAYHGL